MQKLKINKVHNEKEIKYWKTAEEISKIIENTNGVWRTIKIQSSGTFRTKSRKFCIIKMPQYLEKYLLEIKKDRDKNHKIKTAKIVVYSDDGSPNMETALSYLKKFYKKQGFEGVVSFALSQVYFCSSLFK